MPPNLSSCLLSAWLLVSVSAMAQAVAPMRLCADHYPPYYIYEEGKVPRGSLIDFVRLLAERLEIPLQLSPEIPFVRCVQMIYKGEMDITAGLLDTPERRTNLHMIAYMDHSTKAFFARSDSSYRHIERWESLAGLRIGTTHGFNYFDRFDEESLLFEKHPARSVEHTLKRLLAGRVDLAIATLGQATYLINSNQDFKERIIKVPYEHIVYNPVFIGISKRSPYANRVKDFEVLIAQMRSSGELDEIVANFYSYP